ncbi:hypothetical protein Poly21_18320 [Allorhodopirellula heiligendammensis]|uniref:Uncharacterized protein n=1 Tax=Allorhodopirellula heiligendammensis TaxID=2714739 RepID=A0A5C6C6P4_9BACT|nr:hypothetical protein Poly21_18320 [Allorhodopirellula heiligendammensis]
MQQSTVFAFRQASLALQSPLWSDVRRLKLALMTDPYEPPAAKSSEQFSTDTGAPGASKTRRVFGWILIVLAGLSLRGIQRPVDSTGNLADDLPFLGGQLFVSAAVATVGLFLLWKQPSRSKVRDE